MQVLQEARFVLFAQFGLLDRGQRARDAGVKVLDAGLVALEVFLAQHVQADRLRGHCVGRQMQVAEFHLHPWVWWGQPGRPVPQGGQWGVPAGTPLGLPSPKNLPPAHLGSEAILAANAIRH